MSTTSFTPDASDDNVWGGDFVEDPAQPAQAPAPEDDAAEDEEDEQPQVAPITPASVPDSGPGDLKVALKESRAEMAAVKAQLAAFQSQQQQQQAREQAAAQQQRLAQDLSQLHPDDIPAYLQAQEQQRQQAFQQQAQQQQAHTSLKLSEEYARAAFPDYDAQVDKLLTKVGAPIAHWASTQPNPAMAVYELAKSFHTDADLEAAKAQAAQEAIAKFTGQQSRNPAPQAQRLGSLPSAARPDSAQTAVQQARKALSAPVGTDAWDRQMDKLLRMADG